MNYKLNLINRDSLDIEDYVSMAHARGHHLRGLVNQNDKYLYVEDKEIYTGNNKKEFINSPFNEVTPEFFENIVAKRFEE